MRKNIFIIIFILLVYVDTSVYSADLDECSTFSSKDNYLLYQQRVKCICDKYKSPINVLNIKNNYLKIEKDSYSLANIKKIHRDNMNNIYKCALLITQKKSLLLIKNDLIKKSPILLKKIEGKLNSNISKIDNISNNLGCTNSKNKNSIIKLILLKQATYQTCKYVNYLEYAKDYNKNISNLLISTKTKYTPDEIIQKQLEEVSAIDKEIEHTYTIFPLVFHAYTEYENNITIHFLLQLLRDDYISFREKLHKSLNPINQVVYKIINAMKK